MGLSVTAYRKITKLDALFDADGEPVNPLTRQPYEFYFQVYVSPDFPAQAEGLEDRAVYSHISSKNFWSASYGRYNAWREHLAKLAGYLAVPFEKIEGYSAATVMSHQKGAFEVSDGPFHELLCFSDSDGVFGTLVCTKLARDFAQWDDRAKALNDDWFYENYTAFRECFEMGSDGGAVSFR